MNSPFFLLSWKAGLDGWGKMWSQSYIILSSSFEGRSLSLLFLSPCCSCAYHSVSHLDFALLCSFSLWMFLLSHTSCLPSHPSSFSHCIMFCCSPFPAMQHRGLPSRDTPQSDGECGIYWGGRGGLHRNVLQGAEQRENLGRSSWYRGGGSLQLLGEDEGGGRQRSEQKQDHVVTSGQCSISLP